MTARQFRTGDNLISILKSHGFTDTQRRTALSNSGIKEIIFQTDARYLFKETGKQKELRFFHPTKNLGFKVTKAGSKVSVKSYIPKFQVRTVAIQGPMGYSIQSAIENKTSSQWVSSRFLDAYKIDNKEFRKLPRGTRYSLTVEKLFEGPHFVRYGEVLQTNLVMNGKAYPKKFVKLKDGGFFISTVTKQKPQSLYAPVSYIRISSTFKSHRRHPVTKRVQAHLGVDFELPVGSPVFSAERGTVIRKGYQRAAGNYVVIRHQNGLETSYNHLQKIGLQVRPGRKVSAGEKIGTIGCTGYCTQPHLHFAVKKNGKMVNPLPFLRHYHAPSEKYLAGRGYIKSSI